MNESQRIADQLHRAFFGVAWHGPCVKDTLAGVTAEAADAHPLQGVHSIWELVHHLNAWIVEVNATLRGKEYESMKGEKDWPPVTDTSSAAWDRALSTLERSETSIEETMRDFPPEKLGEGDRSYYHIAHGIVQHNLYHAGQIALLKKYNS
jgi:hypothetical protein